VFGRRIAPDTLEQARHGVERLSASGELNRIVRKWSGKPESSAAPRII
jgi:ABC-type amino acid transport substrate-binding protein